MPRSRSQRSVVVMPRVTRPDVRSLRLTEMRQIETIIVGGGPGGSSCAWELRRQGRECLVLDRKAMPRLKLCAGWVTPKVIQDLAIDPCNYPHGLIKLEKLQVFVG